ncbi:MAG TPA: penicillin-binding protein [Treponema sp.]|nr:penicillin-binding protein [Treponema sp.]
MKRIKIWPFIFTILLFSCAAGFGAALGLGLAYTKNTKNTENFMEFEVSYPTRLLDINGEVITEFSSTEKQEFISFNDLPQQVVDALLTREDRIFYDHPGFSIKALVRAVIGVLTHNSLGGGSTLTQQIAGTLYCDRTEKSVSRKLKELWWAIQMERRYTKSEILELYLNKIYFGGGTYGVNAACKYYFGHDATEVTPAEAAILVIQLSNPTKYNPFEYPNRAMAMQQNVLDAMVADGYITKEESEESFDNYWAEFDYLRTSASVHTMEIDNAPWFSEYVRRELSGMMYGTEDIYTSGYTVNTTLNLSHQRAAEEIMHDYIVYANETYQSTMSESKKSTFKDYVQFTELFCLVFNLPAMKVSEQRAEVLSMNEFANEINPIIDIVSMINGIETLKSQIVPEGNNLLKRNSEKTTIEGTMIALENETGYIDALVGGSKYESSNQFIRAVQAKLQPGSTFKPLYYSAAIDSRQYTMTTIISDTPIVFRKDDGSPYIPQDFRGEYEGDVEMWYALAHSMNIPSLKILDGIGFDAAITRATDLTGIPPSEWDARGIKPVYPLGLGVCSVRPVEMAKAFATIANNGLEVTPIAIRTVEDRSGNIVMSPEQDAINARNAKGDGAQIISPQTAFIMQEMLKKTVQSGTLATGSNFDSTYSKIKKRKGTGSKFKFTAADGSTFYMPAAGKTGTTQNWADAWTVGFTPYYTAAFWFGFDRPGQSLGLKITGSTLAGVAWGDFMNVANKGKAYKPFVKRIPDGIVALTVCSETGLLLTPECGDDQVRAYYLAGTEPTTQCEKHANNIGETIAIDRFDKELKMTGLGYEIVDDGDLVLNLDFMNQNNNSSGNSWLDDFVSSGSGDDDSLNFNVDDYVIVNDGQASKESNDDSDGLDFDLNLGFDSAENKKETEIPAEEDDELEETGMNWLLQ